MACSCCPCFTGKNKIEDDMYSDPERDKEDGDFSDTYSEINAMMSDVDEDDLPPAVDELSPDEEAELPEVIITEATFQKEGGKKRKQLKTLFKKMKKPMGKVRFASNTKVIQTSDEKTTLLDSRTESQDSGYGTTLAPLKRSDSLESFMSALSSATCANAEEFGDELSPSRVQVIIQYDQKRWTLVISVKQAECLVTTNKVQMYWQVHMTLLPLKKHRFKTRYKSTSTPIFNQTFEADNIPAQALKQVSIRVRIYGRAGRTGRKKIAGEAEIDLANILDMPDKTIKEWRVLKRKKDLEVEVEA